MLQASVSSWPLTAANDLPVRIVDYAPEFGMRWIRATRWPSEPITESQVSYVIDWPCEIELRREVGTMRRFILSLGAALVLAAGPALVQAQGTKSVSGSITAIASDSITVKAADGKDMTFVIDSKTEVIAPGGATKTKAAQAAGKGTAVTDVLKTGQAVEIRYEEAGMRADRIRAVSVVSAVPSASGPRAQTASGVVSAISGNSLTVKGSSAEWTFSIDDKTTVSGSGIGTAGQKMASEGKKPTISDLVHEGDSVSVTYRDVEGTKHASIVRVTKRKT